MLSGSGSVRIVVMAAVAFAVAASSSRAEEVKGRWRVEFQVSGVVLGDSIRSSAGNQASGLDVSGEFVTIFDPRPDSVSTLEAHMSTKPRVDLRVSYGLSSFSTGELVVDAGIGYFQAEFKNIEFSHSFDRADGDYRLTPPFPPGSLPREVPACETLSFGDRIPATNCIYFSTDKSLEGWRSELINAGTVDLIPISVNLYARFRPTKRFNPYIGGGIGYIVTKLRTSDRWDQVADELDQSEVFYTQHPPGPLNTRTLIGFDPNDPNSRGKDVKRPAIDVPDSVFLEARAGTEWQWRAKTALFLEAKYAWAQDEIKITADGKTKFGRPTPNIQFRDSSSPQAFPVGGLPAYISRGGIRKALRDPSLGTLIGRGPWPGEYYLNGGTLDLGGWTFAAGLRFNL